MKQFTSEGKLIEAQRIQQRTNYDIEMLTEVGICKGIENYSAVLSGRAPGSMPTTLLDYFPDDFLLFVDESHVTLPQVRAMYGGDYARKRRWWSTVSVFRRPLTTAPQVRRKWNPSSTR